MHVLKDGFHFWVPFGRVFQVDMLGVEGNVINGASEIQFSCKFKMAWGMGTKSINKGIDLTMFFNKTHKKHKIYLWHVRFKIDMPVTDHRRFIPQPTPKTDSCSHLIGPFQKLPNSTVIVWKLQYFICSQVSTCCPPLTSFQVHFFLSRKGYLEEQSYPTAQLTLHNDVSQPHSLEAMESKLDLYHHLHSSPHPFPLCC